MGKWDKDERRWDNEGRRGRKPQDDKDEDTMFKLHEIDLYDQELLELKRLINERSKAPESRRAAYDIAIHNTIDILEEEYVGQGVYPHAAFKQDIASALQGGKYRKIYRNPEDDSENDIVDIGRKKKTSKPKSKRKPVKKVVKKVIKKCKCK